ncbi:HGxxPAAW family protein [Streptomyces montanisoli]|uniref:HGxxPAAW family protein n=1 Tax=Streptomyces montanisoli TaxID=2798581 RepID=UPI001FD7E433|nr:HGxxPAAW family protein [Streptomyces montanisoli]
MAGSSHGHTPAAWTGVIISFIGFCAGGGLMVADNPVGFWVSMGVVLLGGVVGVIMKYMGLGMPKESDEMIRAREEAGRAQIAMNAGQHDTARAAAGKAEQHAKA